MSLGPDGIFLLIKCCSVTLLKFLFAAVLLATLGDVAVVSFLARYSLSL
jgi:hypothetical protein